MADATKHASINGGSLISEIKNVFSLVRTKRTVAFAYGFMFAFVVFTVFLAFNSSSSSSSPWFTNIFSTSASAAGSGTPTSIFSDESYRSHFSSIFSYFFPDSSQQLQIFVPPPLPTDGIRYHNFTAQTPILNRESPSAKNQTQAKELDDEVQALRPNETDFGATKSQNSTAQPLPSNKELSAAKNQTQNKEMQDKVEAFKPNQSIIESPKSTAPVIRTADSVPKSSSASKNTTGKEEKRVVEKGPVTNLTSSLAKKQSNGSNSGMSAANFVESLLGCDLFDGEWVKDDSYPLYKAGSCSLIDEQFNCFLNGRPDDGYQKLKWKPKGCSVPRLNGKHMLELLRGKRLVFVGDSLNRNMWESLVCILRNSVKDQRKVYEADGRHHFRTEASYSFVFKDYNCTVEFFVSPFLVQEWEIADKNGLKKETLRLDIIGRSANQYKNADIIIFNTGHWWTHDKTSKGKDYYQEGSHVYSELNVLEAFRKALTTWARWVDANVNPTKSLVFFRGYSASHFSGGQWNSGGQCDDETEPIKNKTYLSEYPTKMMVLEKVLKGMKFHVSYLNITRLTDYRKDGHPSIYRKQNLSDEERRSPRRFQDCSHWCLPGVPDSWNELLYAKLLIKEYQRNQQPIKP